MLPNSKMYNILFYKKPAKIILNLNNISYISRIAKECDIVRDHASYLIHLFEKQGIISISKRKKRQKGIILTDKGKKLNYHLNIILEALK